MVESETKDFVQGRQGYWFTFLFAKRMKTLSKYLPLISYSRSLTGWIGTYLINEHTVVNMD